MDQLQKSRKPQIIRLHNLEETERQRFFSSYMGTLTELFPQLLQKVPFLVHPTIRTLLPDIYFTWVTIYLCKRRLGEEYTYVTMCKNKHYQEEGVLVNKRYRTLVLILQLIGRNLLGHLVERLWQKGKRYSSLLQVIFRSIGSAQQFLSNLQWFFMMLFMLDATCSPNFVDMKLGLGYIYTFYNQKQTKISYKFEGLLLLAVFIIKGVNFVRKLKHQLVNFQQASLCSEVRKQQNRDNEGTFTQQERNLQEEEELCRICYNSLKEKSCTKCGHVFCWECIISSLEYRAQCPLCRAECLPRQVIQLRNF